MQKPRRMPSSVIDDTAHRVDKGYFWSVDDQEDSEIVHLRGYLSCNRT
jgi:hypothetical protein